MDIWLYMLSLARPLSEEEARAMLARLPEALREQLVGRKGAKRDASLCAYALLRRALHDRCGWEELPEVAFTARGKPYFPSCPDVFFSLSHTRGAVLLALHEQSVGADIERLRPVSAAASAPSPCGEEKCRPSPMSAFFPLRPWAAMPRPSAPLPATDLTSSFALQ